MSNTPRLDKVLEKYEQADILDKGVALIQLARRLERELTEQSCMVRGFCQVLGEEKPLDAMIRLQRMHAELAEARRCLREAIERTYVYDDRDRDMVARWCKAAGRNADAWRCECGTDNCGNACEACRSDRPQKGGVRG